jgi:trimethylamine:corrinoid methyltransferase-like protein
MANSTAALDAGYSGVAGTVTQLSMHTGAGPGTTGANEVTGGTYAKVAKTYSAPTAGAGDTVSAAAFDIPAGTTVTGWGAWNAGTYLFGELLAAAQNFATAGTYTLNSAPYSAS